MIVPVFLGLDEVIEIHHDQLKRYGGSAGIRDIELLKSAIAMPAVGFGGDYMHTDIYEMAAAYLYHIVRNHPFIDGNKRTAAAAALVSLVMSARELNADEESVAQIVLSAAEGKSDKATIARFFKEKAEGGP